MKVTDERKYRILKKFQDDNQFRINFICSGNIIRSPYAQLLFEHMITDFPSLKKIKVESGAVTYQNTSIFPESAEALRGKGIDEKKISAFKPRYYLEHPEMFSQADLILVMTHKHLPRIPLEYREKAFLLSNFALGRDENVPDPFFDPPFSKAYNLIDEALDGLLKLFLKINRPDSQSLNHF